MVLGGSWLPGAQQIVEDVALTSIAEVPLRHFLWSGWDEGAHKIIDEGDHDDEEEDNLSLEREELLDEATLPSKRFLHPTGSQP